MSNEEKFPQEQVESNMNTKDFLIGALIGGIVGATTALLLAPKSGRELRQNINDQTYLIKEKTGHLKETALHKGNELAAAAKEKTGTLTNFVSEQSNEWMNKVKIKKNGFEEYIEDEDEETFTLTDEDIEKKLEETKQSFEETEAEVR